MDAIAQGARLTDANNSTGSVAQASSLDDEWAGCRQASEGLCCGEPSVRSALARDAQKTSVSTGCINRRKYALGAGHEVMHHGPRRCPGTLAEHQSMRPHPNGRIDRRHTVTLGVQHGSISSDASQFVASLYNRDAIS